MDEGDIAIIVRGTPDDDARPGRSLLSWLQSDPEYRGIVSPGRSEPGEGRTLGVGPEVLALLLTPASVLGFLQVLKVWIASRRTQVLVEMHRDGTELTFTVDSTTDPVEVLESLKSFLAEASAETADGGSREQHRGVDRGQ